MQKILVTVIILALARPSWTETANYLYCRDCSESQECDDGTVEESCIMDQIISPSNTTYTSFSLSKYFRGLSGSSTKLQLLASYHGAYCVTIVWKNGSSEQTTRGCRRATFPGQVICDQVKKACEQFNRELISCETCQQNYCNDRSTNIIRVTNTTGNTTIRAARSIDGRAIVKGPLTLRCVQCYPSQICDNPTVAPPMALGDCKEIPQTVSTTNKTIKNITIINPRSHQSSCGYYDFKRLVNPYEPLKHIDLTWHVNGYACVTVVAEVRGRSELSRFCMPKYRENLEACKYIEKKCNMKADTKVTFCSPCYTDMCNLYTEPPKPETTTRPTTETPETTIPETPEPETPEPETTEPETPEPETFRPDTTKPDLPIPVNRCYSCSGRKGCELQITNPSSAPQCESITIYARANNQSADGRISNVDDDPACGLPRVISGEGPSVCYTFITSVKGKSFTTRGCASLRVGSSDTCHFVAKVCGRKYVSCEICKTPLCNDFGLYRFSNGEVIFKFSFSYISYIFVIAIIFYC